MNTDEPNRLPPRDRYLRDPQFAQLVDLLEHAITDCEFTPTEIREAAMLAAIRHENRSIRQSVRLDGDRVPVAENAYFNPGTRAYQLFYRAWTNAVVRPGYDKREWIRMEAALAEAAAN